MYMYVERKPDEITCKNAVLIIPVKISNYQFNVTIVRVGALELCGCSLVSCFLLRLKNCYSQTTDS